jgi:hypothetical protein
MFCLPFIYCYTAINITMTRLSYSIHRVIDLLLDEVEAVLGLPQHQQGLHLALHIWNYEDFPISGGAPVLSSTTVTSTNVTGFGQISIGAIKLDN